MLSGMLPPRHGAIEDSFRIGDDVPLMQEAFANDNPETVEKFRRAYEKGVLETKRDPDAAIALSAEFLKLPPELLAKTKPWEWPRDPAPHGEGQRRSAVADTYAALREKALEPPEEVAAEQGTGCLRDVANHDP